MQDSQYRHKFHTLLLFWHMPDMLFVYDICPYVYDICQLCHAWQLSFQRNISGTCLKTILPGLL